MTTAVKKPGRLFEIGKQTDLPIKKIGEIAYRNMKHRFGRSIVTTSGVILATAFLMAMLIKNSMVASLLNATHTLKNVAANKPLDIDQAKDIRTVLADQQRTFQTTLDDSTKVLADSQKTEKEFAADVAKQQAELTALESAAGVPLTGKESEHKRKKDEVAGYKRDLQAVVAEVKKAQEQYDLDKATVDRTARLLAIVQPNYAFPVDRGTSEERAEVDAQVSFLRRLGNTLEGELQNRAIEEAPRGGGNHPAAGAAPGAPAGGAAAPAAAAAPRAENAEPAGGGNARSLWLTSLALIVAGVGITNAMLMSVTERFREIGTMKCLGALDGFIMKLFLIESAVQGGMGTVMGMLIGTLMMVVYLLVNFGFNLVWVYWPWLDFGRDLLIAFGAGVVISVVGAAFPSLYASRMDPIAAMRQEI